MSAANLTPPQRHAAFARANAAAISDIARVLRTAAQLDAHTDAFRGDLGKA